MRDIVYYVAMSLDGYIAGPDNDIGEYVSLGSGMDQYFADLKTFDTVIMGRRTYEFGFQFGLEAGKPAYDHMDHYIISNTASYPNISTKVKVVPRDIAIIKDLKKRSGSQIYLCGGGVFAGWLLEHEMIDILKIKLSPVTYGDGLKLFGGSVKKVGLELLDVQQHDHGLLIITYNLMY